MSYRIENMYLRIASLEKIWYGWVEYFRPLPTSSKSRKYQAYVEAVREYEADHYGVIVKISLADVGSVEATNAKNALYVYNRISKASHKLRAMLLEVSPIAERNSMFETHVGMLQTKLQQPGNHTSH